MREKVSSSCTDTSLTFKTTRIEKNREEQAREVAKGGGQAATNAESIVLPQQEVGQIKVVREEGLVHRKKSCPCDQQTVGLMQRLRIERWGHKK